MKKNLMILGCAMMALVMFNGVTYSPLVQVVPGPGLPPQVKCLRSNNNLDLIQFDGRIFLAFRTAPTHFAGTKTHMYIVSTKDQKAWDYEAEVFMGTDMREPRLLAVNGKLMFYYFQAGKSMVSFTPQHIFAMERKGPGDWTKPKPVFDNGCVLWRSKTINGKAYLTTYCGEGEYTGGNSGIKISLLTTEDGYNFTPVNPKHQVISTGGSETDFEIDRNGDLYGVIRNEAGDGKNWNSKVCKAPASDLANWQCVDTTYKPDSPLVFKHGDDIYVIGRRSLDGAFDKGDRWLPQSTQSLYYMARYWWTKKRTTLYKLDKASLKLEPVLDFPSKGDTSFAGLIQQDENHYLMYNYSSAPEGKDRVWMSGQLHKTFIYSTVITFN